MLSWPSISTSSIDYRRSPLPVSISAKFILGGSRALSAAAGQVSGTQSPGVAPRSAPLTVRAARRRHATIHAPTTLRCAII
ncbi:unnamed protein product [Colias eurytheme]|nr:unnamed protein product [Colias eurytheme]